MIVTDMPVESLVPYARNPRNNTAAIDAVKASIAEFGFRQPIVVDEKLVVIVGHTRLEAAKALGLKMVPVHVAEGLTPAQARAYRLMELDPKYVDVIVTRWQDYTGNEAVLDGEDRTFEDIKVVRLGADLSEKDAASGSRG